MDAPSKRAIFARGLKILKPPSQHLSLNFEIKKEKQTQIRFKILRKIVENSKISQYSFSFNFSDRKRENVETLTPEIRKPQAQRWLTPWH